MTHDWSISTTSMLDRIFVDTNIMLDFLLKREGFFRAAQALFVAFEYGRVRGVVSSLTVLNAHYSYRKEADELLVRRELELATRLVEVYPLDMALIKEALDDASFLDFEDGVQHASAMRAGCSKILTRNLSDYKRARLPVMTAASYLAMA